MGKGIGQSFGTIPAIGSKNIGEITHPQGGIALAASSKEQRRQKLRTNSLPHPAGFCEASILQSPTPNPTQKTIVLVASDATAPTLR